MKVVDANILLYARDTSSRHHSAARAWLEGELSGTGTVGFALVALLAFVRIATSPRIMTTALTPAAAFDQVEEWLALPSAVMLRPGPRHLEICRGLLEAVGTAGNLTTDAHLAALAIERGAALASFDGDFHRFAKLKLEYLAP